jgi:beta-glucosidase
VSQIPLKKGMSSEEIARAAESIVSQLTLDEKIRFMSGSIMNARYFIRDRFQYNYRPWIAGGSERFNVPPVKFCDGPRGVVSGRSTCFPVAMARGASWDVEMEERVGEAIGREIRAHAGNYFGGVCINLLRHPAWGRAQETFGEDSYHLGEMGAALVRGVQRHNVMACIKHYAANSIENCRFRVDVRMNERTLREVYLPHFKRCIDQGAASVMSAYNKLRGTHCCHHSYLQKDILKGDWGFTGFILSDFIWGVKDALEAVNGGMDIEMPFTRFFGRKLKKAFRKGLVVKRTLDEAVLRIIQTVLKFTLAPDPREYDKSLVACPDHRDLAREAAEKSMVLLKNRDNVLPLDRHKIRKLAVIGELAAAPNIGDYGSSRVRPPYVVTILDGLQAYLAGEVELIYCDGKDHQKARAAARSADAVVVVAGYKHNDEGEQVLNLKKNKKVKQSPYGGDRKSITLKETDEKMINAVAPENCCCAVILIGGSAIVMERWKERAPAILMAWYPGMEGGTALARILFGEVNPSGKLPFTIPFKASDLPFFNDQADETEYGYYHGYTLFEKQGLKAAFLFGFGLSYTTFAYSNLQVESKDGTVTATFDLANTGERAGAEAAQLYVGLENSSVDRPVKILKGFAKVFLRPGEMQSVSITVKHDDLAWYNPDRKGWEIEQMEYTLYVGPSSKPEELLKAGFRV